MGGKSSTTTQKVTIPPEVMARYNAVNKRAESVANTPFQQYSTNPNDFVAPINQTQQQGIQNIGNVQNAALPFYGAGANLTMGGAGSVGRVSGDDINYYMSPYLNSVVGATLGNLAQEQGIQRQEQIGNAIRSGAFGGDRAGLAQANLARQQGMAYGSTAANLLNQGYGQALGAAQAYQGVEAQNLARQLQAGQQIAGLGSGLTQTQLQAGQALLGAGTAQQQTDQAGLSALYNQFQQERSYPFQVSQFLANIAMGTGALSGSTTTTQQPVPFFSDPRLKENMQEIGQTHDGLPIYKYNLKGHPGETQIGLNADEVEQMKPEAVGLAGGYKTVDYDAATRPRGGLDPAESMGGAVVDLEPHEYRENFAAGGGMPNFEAQLAQLYAQFGSPHGAQPGGGLAGPYGGRASYVPQASLPVGQLKTAGQAPRAPSSVAQDMMSGAKGVSDLGGMIEGGWDKAKAGLGYAKSAVSAAAPPAAPVQLPSAARSRYDDSIVGSGRYARGGLAGYADGGDVEDPMKSYGAQQGGLDIPTEQPDIKPLEPAKPPPAQNSVMGDVLNLAKTAASIYAMSDERVKDGMQRVGQLDNGLPVYKYSIGNGPTQIGLSAQEAGGLHPGAAMADDRGILHLDYDRATRAYGGLVPRHGYAEGGNPSFDDALARTLQFEGGYTVDTGGPTMMGISSRANPDVDLDRVSRDPQYKANIYRERYWNPIGADAMDPRMAPIAFDTAVNLGVGGARRLLDQAGGDPEKLLALRQQHYDNLIARDPEKYGAYQRGWENRVNALRQGLGGGEADMPPAAAREAQASGTPPGARQKGFIEGLMPTKRDPRTGEESTDWKKIIIPTLTGLGAMASSPSLYAGSAILQGLGAGAQAYSNLEKREADIASTEASTFATAQQAANLSTRQVGNVTFIRLANGKEVPIWEWIRTREPVLGGQAGMAAAERLADRYLSSEGRTTDAASPALRASPAGGAPAAPSAPAAPTAPGQPATLSGAPAGVTGPAEPAQAYTPFGRASQAAAERDIEATLGPNGAAAQATSAAYMNASRAQGDAARDAGAPLFETALNVSKTVAGKGFDAPGAAYPARAQLANAANTLARAFGYTGPPFSATDTQQQLAQKYNIIQAAAQARGGGQESLGALQTMIEALPRTDMSPDAQAQVTANLLMLNQMAKDRDAHRIKYGERSFQSFVAAGDAFRQDNPEARYTREVDLLKTVIRNDPKAIEMLVGGRATGPQIEEYFKKIAERSGKPYIPGVSRYFLTPGG